MTFEKTAKTSIDSLLKLAQDMVGMVDDQATQKASPEDVLEGLNGVISQLTAIAEALPVSEAPKEAEPAPGGEPSPQVAQLTAQLEELQSKIAIQEKEKLATRIAELYDDKEYQTRFDEVMKSDKPIEYWTAKAEGIEEVRSQLPIGIQQSAKTFSYTKVAKQDSERLFTI